MIRTAQRRFAPTVIGITRNSDRHQIGMSDRHRRNTQPDWKTAKMIIDRQSTGITTGVCAFSPAGFKKPATSDSPERMLGRGRLDGADRPVPRAHFWLPKPRECIQSPDSRGRNRRDGDGRTRLGSQGLWPVIRKEFFLGMVVARQIRWLGKVGHSPE
jgi:hypothetical protein